MLVPPSSTFYDVASNLAGTHSTSHGYAYHEYSECTNECLFKINDESDQPLLSYRFILKGGTK